MSEDVREAGGAPVKPRMVEDAPRSSGAFMGKSDAEIRRELLCWKAIKQISYCLACGAKPGQDCLVHPQNPESWHNFYDLHYLRWTKYENLSDLEKAMLGAAIDE